MAILRLPDELLLDTFGYLFLPPPSVPPSAEAKPHRPDGASLPNVCRRFHRLATPGLYTHLRFNFEESPSSATQLYRTLSEKPELRPHCRSLRLTLPDPDADLEEHMRNGGRLGEVSDATKEIMSMASEMMSWLENARDLFISGYFIHHKTHLATWALVRSAGVHMSKLENLSLGKQVFVERVCDLLVEMKQLRTLEIGIGVAVEDITPPAPEVVGSSSVTSISVDYLLAVPENLERLLLLPAALEHFAFRGMSPGAYWSWSLPRMIGAVEPHRDTLRTLQVASGRASGDDYNPHSLEDEVEDVDLSGFKELREITFVAAPV
ncbi:hypothetical protein B0T14DRAFT_601249 [Immersiella caudata]|uniref:F-box domain-containing protein n=1 Tax=Immersiella caudata TaxID=314043 RepID=A0AA40C231_9PEZI|nr:hypothetical protein B0T14DRAFT_601249 [Immersiella caudata]